MSLEPRSAPLGLRHYAGVLLAYVVLAALTQIGGILREVIDWDESTFILLASSLLNGHLPYTALFDNKPPMIFVLLAGAMALFGENLWAVRLVGDVFLVLSGLAVFGTVVGLGGTVTAAAQAGAVCIAAHAPPLGQYTSTEIPATAMLMLALWTLIARGDSRSGAILAGLSISAAVLIRTNLAFVAVAVALVLLGRDWRRFGALGPVFGSTLPFAIAGLTPLAAIVMVYAAADALVNLRLGLVDVPMRYAAEQRAPLSALWRHAVQWKSDVSRDPLLWGSLTVLALAGMLASLGRAAGPRTRQGIVLLWVMGLSTTLGMLLSGPAYRHYWLQLFPFLAVFAGLAMGQPRPWLRLTAQGMAGVMIAVALAMTVPQTLMVLRDPEAVNRHHVVRAAAAHIAPQLKGSDRVWAAENHLVLWYLGVPPISGAIAHPSNITRGQIIDTLVAAGHASPDLLGSILRSPPAFIVTGETGAAPRYLPDGAGFDAFLERHYRMVHQAPGIAVFARICCD